MFAYLKRQIVDLEIRTFREFCVDLDPLYSLALGVAKDIDVEFQFTVIRMIVRYLVTSLDQTIFSQSLELLEHILIDSSRRLDTTLLPVLSLYREGVFLFAISYSLPDAYAPATSVLVGFLNGYTPLNLILYRGSHLLQFLQIDSLCVEFILELDFGCF